MPASGLSAATLHAGSKRACALCKRCVDPFHVVERATDVLDEVRKDRWCCFVTEPNSYPQKHTRPKANDQASSRVQAVRKKATAISLFFWQSAKSPDAEQKDLPGYDLGK